MEHSATIASVPAAAPPAQTSPRRALCSLSLGPSAVFNQAKHDLFGTKDVQDAITASYVWLADQQGHIALGLIPTLLACWAISDFVAVPWRTLSYIAVAVAIFAYWVKKEEDDYRETLARAKGSVFPFDKTDIRWNMKTALFFFALGGAAVTAGFVNWRYLVLVIVLFAWPALRIIYWWLRRKLAFQQADLPYLFRLANFHGNLDEKDVRAISALANMKARTQRFWHVVFGHDDVPDPNPPVRHLLICGSLAMGKTTLAVGIGCEFAFALGCGRFLSAQELLELMAKSDMGEADDEYNDGRVIWPWHACHLLIMDDLDAGVATHKDGALKAASLIHPDEYESALKRFAGCDPPLGWLGQRRSVWIIDDPRMSGPWQATVARMLGVPTAGVMIIDLEKTSTDINPGMQPAAA